MCGLFGTITKNRKPDIGVLRALTLVNRERGKESLGFFDSGPSIYKKGDDPLDVLASAECTEWLDKSEQNSWFIVGHTRFSTRGTVCDSNSHPFYYGDIIGAHNGMLDAPRHYTVDSEYAIDLLNKHDSNYHDALKNVWGYWLLSWYDTKKKELFINMYDLTCGLAKYRNAWYFSSDPNHLATVLGVRDTIILKNGQTVSFRSNGTMRWLKKFKPSMSYSYKKDGRTYGSYDANDYYINSSQSGYSSNNYSPSNNETYIRDYDEEFRSMWAEYAHQYED